MTRPALFAACPPCPHNARLDRTVSFVDDTRVRAEPFEVFELDLSLLWADVARAPAPG